MNLNKIGEKSTVYRISYMNVPISHVKDTKSLLSVMNIILICIFYQHMIATTLYNNQRLTRIKKKGSLEYLENIISNKYNLFTFAQDCIGDAY